VPPGEIAMWGLAGGDNLFASGSGRVFVSGGAGSDTITADGDADIEVAGGGGDDTIDVHGGRSARVLGGGGNDTIVHGDTDTAVGRLLGGAGEDDVSGAGAGDLLVGGSENDGLFGRGGSDELRGGPGDDELFGDRLGGGNGRDVVSGGDGDDRIIGGFMADDLLGGAGRDRFLFSFGISIDGDIVLDSKGNNIDRILPDEPGGIAFDAPGRRRGDLINVSAIDGNEGVDGDQSFTFGSRDAGGLWAVDEGQNTVVRANTDADDVREFVLIIADGDVRAREYTASDFVL
jgi:hypothetical protein